MSILMTNENNNGSRKMIDLTIGLDSWKTRKLKEFQCEQSQSIDPVCRLIWAENLVRNCVCMACEMVVWTVVACNSSSQFWFWFGLFQPLCLVISGKLFAISRQVSFNPFKFHFFFFNFSGFYHVYMTYALFLFREKLMDNTCKSWIDSLLSTGAVEICILCTCSVVFLSFWQWKHQSANYMCN
jgi:hypothetical protein